MICQSSLPPLALTAPGVHRPTVILLKTRFARVPAATTARGQLGLPDRSRGHMPPPPPMPKLQEHEQIIFASGRRRPRRNVGVSHCLISRPPFTHVIRCADGLGV